MAMSVMAMAQDYGDAFYSTLAWRQVVETHLLWMRENLEVEILTISPQLGYKYEGDFYGALTDQQIPQYLHWTILRLNGLYSPSDYQGQAATLMIPNQSGLRRLALMAQSVDKKVI